MIFERSLISQLHANVCVNYTIILCSSLRSSLFVKNKKRASSIRISGVQIASAQNREKLTPSPLFEKCPRWLNPPCPCGNAINFRNLKFFVPKSADVRIWRTPSCPQNVRTGQPLLAVDVFYGQPLTAYHFAMNGKEAKVMHQWVREYAW